MYDMIDIVRLLLFFFIITLSHVKALDIHVEIYNKL